MEVFKLDESGRASSRIAFKPYNSNAMSFLSFKIDTGADFTTIPKEYLFKLGYDDSWISQNVILKKGSVTTATGTIVETHIVQLPLLNFYGYEAVNWPFCIMLDEQKDDGTIIHRDYRALLGLDLLGGFNFLLDNDNDCCTLTKTKTFKRRQPFLPNQEIHEIHTI